MLCRYNFYGGIRRPPTPLYASKRFGPSVTMALSAASTPWYCPPPSVNNIRGWDEFFLNSPQSSPFDRLDFNLNFVVPSNSHGQNHPTLGFTPEILFHRAGLPSLLASSRKTLKTSIFYHPCTTFSHKLLNEVTQPEPYQQSNHRKERKIPSPALKEPPVDQDAGVNNQGRLLAELCLQKRTGKGRGRTKFGHRKEGKQLTFHHPRRSLVQANARGFSDQHNPQFRWFDHQQLGEHPQKQHGVTNFGRSEECRQIAISQCSKSNNCQFPVHTQPPVPFVFGSATSFVNSNRDPWDIHGAYPNSFCSMMSDAETTKEEVSIGHPSKPFAPAPPCTRSCSRSQSTPCTRGQPSAPCTSAPM